MRHDEPIVRSYSTVHPQGSVRLPAQPGWFQLLQTRSGGLVARVRDRLWTVPAGRVLVIADGARVEVVTTRRRTSVRCVYLRAVSLTLDAPVVVLQPDALGEALLSRAVDAAPLWGESEHERALVTLLVAELAREAPAPLMLDLPEDPLARDLAETILSDPGRSLSDALARVPGARRTFERRFRRELDTSLAAWHRRARMLQAVLLLGSGESVTAVAAEVGYSTPSAFAHAFRRELAATPTSFTASQTAGKAV